MNFHLDTQFKQTVFSFLLGNTTPDDAWVLSPAHWFWQEQKAFALREHSLILTSFLVDWFLLNRSNLVVHLVVEGIFFVCLLSYLLPLSLALSLMGHLVL